MEQEHHITGSAGAVKTLFDGLRKFGLPTEAAEALTGLTYDNLMEPDRRIPIKNVIQLAQNVREITGVPSIGLKLGTDDDVIYPSGIGWSIMSNSRTLGEGIRQFCRFTAIISEFLKVETKEERDRVSIIFRIDPPEFYTSFSMEIILSRFLKTLQAILNTRTKPSRAGFQHAKPEYVAAYHEWFGNDIMFDQPECSVQFPLNIMNHEISNRDAYLETFLTRHAEKLLGELDQSGSTQHKVKRVIIKQLYSGQVDVELVSESLRMSRTTLFRKLKEEGWTFKELLRSTRHELAKDYLQQKDLSISEIGFLLGFSDPSSFNRAFRHWEGVSPQQHRNSSPSPPTPS